MSAFLEILWTKWQTGGHERHCAGNVYMRPIWQSPWGQKTFNSFQDRTNFKRWAYSGFVLLGQSSRTRRECVCRRTLNLKWWLKQRGIWQSGCPDLSPKMAKPPKGFARRTTCSLYDGNPHSLRKPIQQHGGPEHQAGKSLEAAKGDAF